MLIDAADTIDAEQRDATDGIDAEPRNLVPLMQRQRPIMVIPYVKGVGERLQNLAREFQCDTWFKYPGRLSDMFTKFKGTVHPSKARDIVCCTGCSCGLEYVGELHWNLKVRLHEHLQNSSKSTLSAHFLEHKNMTGHKPALENTTILAKEGNSLKRKLLESICIQHKSAHLCNSGVSIEMPAAWDVCLRPIDQRTTDDV